MQKCLRGSFYALPNRAGGGDVRAIMGGRRASILHAVADSVRGIWKVRKCRVSAREFLWGKGGSRLLRLGFSLARALLEAFSSGSWGLVWALGYGQMRVEED